MRYLWDSLRFRLFVLIFLAILPGILLTIYTAIANQQHEIGVLLLIWVSSLVVAWVGGDILILRRVDAHHRVQLHERANSQLQQLMALQRSNIELNLAYSSTLESWSRAVDLRDRETEGHSWRVADLTLRLSRAMSVNEAEMIHIRRGALLHDIGKLGIPDRILLKPGPLSEQERDVIREHPRIAFELLAPIAHLRPALDIPYCHHERWDGTGYPRGLKGEKIPLVARIFAVADVWDALLSDRPYRKGWSEESARAYLVEQAGRHFDPQVVEVFLSLLAADENAIRSE